MDYKPGDIFLTDSSRLGARIVKFLMKSPTVWHHILRMITHTMNDVEYYHVGMVTKEGLVIEQQKEVEYEDIYDAITKKKKYIVYRKKNLLPEQIEDLIRTSDKDIGKSYDVLLIFGRLLTWLTGIKWFCRNMQSREKEFCVTRVALWYKVCTGETFGCKTHHEVTTDIIDDWCRARPDEWEVVDIK